MPGVFCIPGWVSLNESYADLNFFPIASLRAFSSSGQALVLLAEVASNLSIKSLGMDRHGTKNENSPALGCCCCDVLGCDILGCGVICGPVCMDEPASDSPLTKCKFTLAV